MQLKIKTTKASIEMGSSKDLIYSRLKHLESKQKEEGHHQTEETHSFGQCESQNSVGEKLLFEGWVTGIANDEGTED